MESVSFPSFDEVHPKTPFLSWEKVDETESYAVYEHEVKLYGETVTFRDWVPKHPALITVQHEPEGAVIEEFAPSVIIASGWCLSPEPYYHQARELAQMGRRVTTFDAPHGVDAHGREGDEYKHMPEAEIRRMAVLLDLIEHRGMRTPVDVIAHSEGAFYTTLAADMHPEYFRVVAYQAPSGITTADDEEHSALRKALVDVPKLTFSYTQELLGHILKAYRDDDSAMEKLSLAFANTWSNMALHMKSAWTAVWALSDADIRDMILRMKERGIEVSFLIPEEDRTFPLDDMQVKGEDFVADMIIMRGDRHNAMLTESKAPKYARIVSDLFTRRDKKDSV